MKRSCTRSWWDGYLSRGWQRGRFLHRHRLPTCRTWQRCVATPWAGPCRSTWPASMTLPEGERTQTGSWSQAWCRVLIAVMVVKEVGRRGNASGIWSMDCRDLCCGWSTESELFFDDMRMSFYTCCWSQDRHKTSDWNPCCQLEKLFLIRKKLKGVGRLWRWRWLADPIRRQTVDIIFQLVKFIAASWLSQKYLETSVSRNAIS